MYVYVCICMRMYVYVGLDSSRVSGEGICIPCCRRAINGEEAGGMGDDDVWLHKHARLPSPGPQACPRTEVHRIQKASKAEGTSTAKRGSEQPSAERRVGGI